MREIGGRPRRTPIVIRLLTAALTIPSVLFVLGGVLAVCTGQAGTASSLPIESPIWPAANVACASSPVTMAILSLAALWSARRSPEGSERIAALALLVSAGALGWLVLTWRWGPDASIYP